MKISKIKYSMLIPLALIIILIACSETPVDPSKLPKALTMTDLKDTVKAGYKWFLPAFRDYQPDTTIVRQIKEAFAANPCRFYIFVNATCECVGTQVEFPSIMKTITSANIDTVNFEMYDSHGAEPYPEIKTNRFPSCFIIRNKIAVYSVTDTLVAYPDKNYTVEQVILMGMQK